MAEFVDNKKHCSDRDDLKIETVFSRFKDNLVELHRDESTAGPEPFIKFSFTYDLAESVSESIGAGLTINKTTSPPSIHMANITLAEMLERAPLLKEELIDKIGKYEHIAAKTPSVEAMRAMFLLLVEISNDKQTRKDILALLKDIKKLDLSKSSQDKWERKVTVKVDDISFNIDISLDKFNLANRALAKTIPTQLSEHAKHNKHQFKLDIRANKQKKSWMLKFLEQKSEQIAGFTFGSVFTGVCILGAHAGMLGAELFTRVVLQSNVLGKMLSAYGDYGALVLGMGGAFVLLDKSILKIALRNKEDKSKT